MKVDYFGQPLVEGDIVIYERDNNMLIVKIDSFNERDEIVYYEVYNFNRKDFYKFSNKTTIKTNRIFKYKI
ncbi:MAG: hypothetical protein E6R13_06130 [Spirochaetes bacterium]|nr:MAG: hypothetical protein E6R13_06130 [Spirochaetota bacterium]